MSKINFTSGRVNSLGCEAGKKQTIHWDAKTPSLGLRVMNTGVRSYIFEATLNSKTIRTTIGRLESWKLGEAQKEATRLRTMVDRGIDPRKVAKDQALAEKIEKEAEQARSMLIQTAWEKYLETQQPHWSERHYLDHLNAASKGGEAKKRGKGTKVRGALYPVLQMKFSDITSESLTSWVAFESRSRANKARQAFEMFRTFWRWAAGKNEFAGMIDLSVIEDRDLKRTIPGRKAKRFDVLEKSQLKDWFAAVRNLRNPAMRAYLQALILTGARREEMAQLRWEDVDKHAIWVKDKVEEEGRKIPLTPYLSMLINSLPRREGNPWVFSSPTSASGRITEPRIPHNRALSAAGLNHVSLHGLRRSFASLAEWVEMPTGIAAQIMGHKPNATAEKHYINRPIELLLKWHTKLEKWILEQAEVEFDYENEQPRLRAVK